MSQIQNTDVDAAASPVAPMRVPIQNASTEMNSVISSDDATAGSATRAIVRGSGSATRCDRLPLARDRDGGQPVVRLERKRAAGARARRGSACAGSSGERRDSWSRSPSAPAPPTTLASAVTIGVPGVAALHHARVQRHLAEQRQLHRLRQALAAARAEQRASACRSAGTRTSSCSRRCRAPARRRAGTSSRRAARRRRSRPAAS